MIDCEQSKYFSFSAVENLYLSRYQYFIGLYRFELERRIEKKAIKLADVQLSTSKRNLTETDY